MRGEMTRRRSTPREPAALARDVWAWIPSFKAVAEASHLPTAAAKMHVSASALSRTVRRVEEALGRELFVRSGRRMHLNAAGHRLLLALQRASSVVEEALPSVVGPDEAGTLSVSALGVLTDHLLLPCLLELTARRPGVLPIVSVAQSREANQRLVAGELDLALYYDATSHPDVRCVRIGSVRSHVFAGAGHRLFKKRRATRAEVLAEPFSVASVGVRGTPMDGWPVELERRVGFQIMNLSTNLAVALTGRYLVVLPDVVARPWVERGELWLLDAVAVPDVDVFAAVARRRPLVDELLDELRARIADEHARTIVNPRATIR